MEKTQLIAEIKEMLKEFEKAKQVFEYLARNDEINSWIDLANKIVILRWGFNDHGIVHSLITTRNAVKMAILLKQAGFTFDSEREVNASFDEVLSAVIIASYMHDMGNAVNRKDHELLSLVIAKPFVEKIFSELGIRKELLPYVFEGILCHMCNWKPTSLEARIIPIADALDMEEGRARLPYKLKGPDIHKFSALAIEKVEISKGSEKPVKVVIHMRNPAGTFQIEEVMMPKVKGANAKEFLELYAKIGEKEELRYL